MNPKVRIPGSKSYTNRALLMAAMTQGSVRLIHPSICDDTRAMIRCLETLGVSIRIDRDQIIVQGDVRAGVEKAYDLYCADSGTTVRFLLPLVCTLPGIKTMGGSKRLNERPIQDLVVTLRSAGAQIEYMETEGKLPVRITSSRLSSPSFFLKSDVSSQFCTALLLIGPTFPEGMTLHLTTPLISKSYVEMTLHSMRDWGIAVTKQDASYIIPPKSRYQKEAYVIEGDFSSAGYFFARAALTQSTLVVENVHEHSVQGDRKILPLLERMGNEIHYGENCISIVGRGVIPFEADMENCPDQVLTMAVLAAFAQGVTQISGVRSLRVKESDRVAALKAELGKMGIQVHDTQDTLTIYGGNPKGASIETYNDHRMAMAFAIAGRRLPDLTICQPEVVSKTFPTFWELWESIP